MIKKAAWVLVRLAAAAFAGATTLLLIDFGGTRCYEYLTGLGMGGDTKSGAGAVMLIILASIVCGLAAFGAVFYLMSKRDNPL